MWVLRRLDTWTVFAEVTPGGPLMWFISQAVNLGVDVVVEFRR